MSTTSLASTSPFGGRIKPISEHAFLPNMRWTRSVQYPLTCRFGGRSLIRSISHLSWRIVAKCTGREIPFAGRMDTSTAALSRFRLEMWHNPIFSLVTPIARNNNGSTLTVRVGIQGSRQLSPAERNSTQNQPRLSPITTRSRSCSGDWPPYTCLMTNRPQPTKEKEQRVHQTISLFPNGLVLDPSQCHSLSLLLFSFGVLL